MAVSGPALLVALAACSSSESAPPAASAGSSALTGAGAGGRSAGGAGVSAGGASAGSVNIGGGGASNVAGSDATDGGSAAVSGSANAGGSSAGNSAGGSGGTGGFGGSAGRGGGSAGRGGGSAGSGGGSAGNPGAGGSGGADCGFTPVTPNATAATRKVLCYLHSVYGNHILSGQEENNDDSGMNTVVQASGKYPAIRAFDVNNDKAPQQCVDQWNKGGLCMFGYHMGINGNNFNVAANIDNVLKSGTSENKSFNTDLDRIAQYVQPVQQAGGVAILRLFHEAGKGCSWFWWSMGSSQQWNQLFKYAFDYLTTTKKLDNVLWIAPLCGSPDAAWNPGSKYIDFGGADNYVSSGTDYNPMTNLFHQTETAFPNMMVALHECGPIPDPDQLKSSGTKWLFFNVWSGEYMSPKWNATDHVKAVYTHDYVITRDELPSFK